MTLNFKEVRYFKVDSSDLEDLIQETYKIRYEMAAQEEWSNDSSHSYNNIDGKLTKLGEKDLVSFIETEKTEFGITKVLLNDLVRKNLIPAGNWLITVCW